MDLMKIGTETVLHIVDKDTKFSAATFLQGEKTNDVWNAFVLKWVGRYIGYPEKVVLDQGPRFQSADFAALLNSAGVDRKDTGLKSHKYKSFRKVERYHACFRNI